MSASLRKACHACTKAKRKCSPQLPACDRCTKKNIQCTYDLEPVKQLGIASKSNHELSTNEESTRHDDTSRADLTPQLVYSSVAAARDASAAAIGLGELPSSTSARVMLMTDGELVKWFMDYFKQVALDSAEGRPSPFVHISLVSSSMSKSCISGDDSISITSLDTLTESHYLLSQALEALVRGDPGRRKDAETELAVMRMFKVIHDLWSTPPALDNRTPWKQWCAAESVRRAMFAAIFVRGLYMAAINGYVEYEPYFESIPFDPRAGLWEAQNEQDWTQLISRHGGDHTILKSYHEFIEAEGLHMSPAEDGRFQRLLFASYHGPQGIRILRDLDNEYDCDTCLKWW